MGKPAGYIPLAEREFCNNGHSIAEVGLYEYKQYPKCRACAIKSVRKAQTKDTHPRLKLDFAPIEELIPMWRVYQMPNTLQRAYYRSRRQGYATVQAADQLATYIGHHPFTIWGWAFYAESQKELEG